MRRPPRPVLEWKPDGTPVDTRTDDVYYSVDDGLAESRAIFLQAVGLPGAWQGRRHYTIGELGFGTGLNFLATWQMWQARRPPGAWLHFVSFEGYPLDQEDAARALSRWPELAGLADQLLRAWPDRAACTHHLSWPEAGLSLTLHIGDIAETLDDAVLQADAWFLDGFSPARNLSMWAPSLWPKLAQRSRPGAQLATFTVAGAVRRGLAAAGFRVEKRPGHGRKRERLWGQLAPAADDPGARAAPASPAAPLRVGICGAGIGGAWLARCLSDRGADVTLFDPAAGPVQGASGNPAALVMPRLDAGDTPVARLMIEAYLSAQRGYADRPGCTRLSVRQGVRSAAEIRRFERILDDPPLGLDQLEALPGPALLHKGAVLIRPQPLVADLLTGITTRFGAPVCPALAAREINGEPFDVVILASAMGVAAHFKSLGLAPRRGQVEFFQSAVEAPPSGLAAGHYALAAGGLRLWGASFEPDTGADLRPDPEARRANAVALEALNPYWLGDARRTVPDSRVGIRATTPDRQPVIGPAPDEAALRSSHADLRHGRQVDRPVPRLPGIYLAAGFGARGFSWAPWAAALITAQVFADPLPASRSGRDLVAPERQALRDLKRRRG